jgi:hypothetical protein
MNRRDTSLVTPGQIHVSVASTKCLGKSSSGFSICVHRRSSAANSRSERLCLGTLKGRQAFAEFVDDFPTVTREAAISASELAKSALVGQLG